MSRGTLLILQALVAIVSIAAWHVLTTERTFGLALLPPFFFSTPGDVAEKVVKLFATGMIWKHLWITLAESMLAFSVWISLLMRTSASRSARVSLAAVRVSTTGFGVSLANPPLAAAPASAPPSSPRMA